MNDGIKLQEEIEMPQDKQRPGFMVYFCDWDMPRQLLNPEQFKVFFDAVFNYARDGDIPPQFDDRTAQVFFDSFIEKINGDNERYQETCRQRSEAAKKSHRKKPPDASNSMQMQANAANTNTNPNTNRIPKTTEYQSEYQYQNQIQNQDEDEYTRQQLELYRMGSPDDEELPF